MPTPLAWYTPSRGNRGSKDAKVTIGLEGELGHRQLRVRTPRAFEDHHVVRRGESNAVILGGSALPGLVAVAIAADGDATVSAGDDGSTRYAVSRQVRAPAGRARGDGVLHRRGSRRRWRGGDHRGHAAARVAVVAHCDA
jgi:hypothetical protein